MVVGRSVSEKSTFVPGVLGFGRVMVFQVCALAVPRKIAVTVANPGLAVLTILQPRGVPSRSSVSVSVRAMTVPTAELVDSSRRMISPLPAVAVSEP